MYYYSLNTMLDVVASQQVAIIEYVHSPIPLDTPRRFLGTPEEYLGSASEHQ
eukprot:gene714-12016_t